MEGTIGNMRPSTLHFSRSRFHPRQPSISQGFTDAALSRDRLSAFDPNDDDNISLKSYATGLYYNDNLSQLSQADFDGLSSDEDLYLASSSDAEAD